MPPLHNMLGWKVALVDDALCDPVAVGRTSRPRPNRYHGRTRVEISRHRPSGCVQSDVTDRFAPPSTQCHLTIGSQLIDKEFFAGPILRECERRGAPAPSPWAWQLSDHPTHARGNCRRRKVQLACRDERRSHSSCHLKTGASRPQPSAFSLLMDQRVRLRHQGTSAQT